MWRLWESTNINKQSASGFKTSVRWQCSGSTWIGGYRLECLGKFSVKINVKVSFKRISGTGLGLPIVRTHGTLWVSHCYCGTSHKITCCAFRALKKTFVAVLIWSVWLSEQGTTDPSADHLATKPSSVLHISCPGENLPWWKVSTQTPRRVLKTKLKSWSIWPIQLEVPAIYEV